ncbi:MAG: hypothetical protein WD067_01300 [Gaiellaceae bacterium]
MPDLELALRQLGNELDWPAQPRLAPAVAARLREPRRRRLGRPLALAFAVLLAALAVALAVPPARSAILDFFGIGGVEIRRVETLPPLPAERAAPGVRVTLAEARNQVDFDLVVPEGYRRVYWTPGIVTFVWRDRLLMELAGDELLLKKVAGQDTDIDPTDVHGHPGVWIEGAPHGLFLPGGEKRLAGNVLIWVRGDVTFRLEGDFTRERALELAGTLTPRET